MKEIKASFLTVKLLSSRWNVSSRHIWRIVQSGDLRVHHFGKAARFAIDDVIDFERRHRAG